MHPYDICSNEKLVMEGAILPGRETDAKECTEESGRDW